VVPQVRTRTPLCVLCVLCVLCATACRDRASPESDAVVAWREVGSWAGRGNKQTESFTSDTAGFRVRWTTTNETTPGAGTLKVIFRSGDSGREIIQAIDVRGVGSDEEIVAAERPRWYYLTIDSAGVDWTVSVDERIDAQRVSK
jgi:hypothetical protein